MADASTDIAIWSTMEVGLAITAGSLACTRPLFRATLFRLGLTTPSRQYKRNADDKLKTQGQSLPKTIGSDLSRHTEVFPMDKVTGGPNHEHYGSDMIESSPLKTHAHALMNDLGWREKNNGDTNDAVNGSHARPPSWATYRL